MDLIDDATRVRLAAAARTMWDRLDRPGRETGRVLDTRLLDPDADGGASFCLDAEPEVARLYGLGPGPFLLDRPPAVAYGLSAAGRATLLIAGGAGEASDPNAARRLAAWLWLDCHVGQRLRDLCPGRSAPRVIGGGGPAAGAAVLLRRMFREPPPVARRLLWLPPDDPCR